MNQKNKVAITDRQIQALSTKAAEAGDLFMVAICDRALNRDFGSGVTLSLSVMAARNECRRVIADAQQS